jgi:pyridoxamine 5'-phosphate oxidase
MTNLRSPEHQGEPHAGLRDHLRAIPSLVGEAVGFDPTNVPTTPQELFLEWFRTAEEAGIREPHAMSVSTVDADGLPDARMLVLKDLTPDGAWCFAGKRDSSKGRQLAAHPVAALTFYWREQVRSIRIRGVISEGSGQEAIRDFTARSVDARAVALSGRQSTPLDSRDRLPHDIEVTRRRLVDAPGLVPEDWTVWKLDPSEVEFWEGSSTRLHSRLRYARTTSGWKASLLHP